MTAIRTCALLLAALAALAVGCAPNCPPKLAVPKCVVDQSGERLGLIVWIDGLDIEHFNALRSQGKLPNISRYILDRGVFVEDAVASLPTMTYANSVSFVTGYLPGHHGITDNLWFDRNHLIFQDYTKAATYRLVNQDLTKPTVYELLGDDFTATILTPVSRGATRPTDNWATAGLSWFFGRRENINRLTTLRFELLACCSNYVGRWPKLVLAYFPTPDTVGHKNGPDSSRYTEMLVDIDQQVGNICRSLEQAGLLERTYITLVTDHGFCETPRFVDLPGYLNDELGIPTDGVLCNESTPLEKRLARFSKYRIVGAPCGRRRCALNLRAGDYWWQRPGEQEIDGFAQRFADHAQRVCGKSFPQLLAELAATDLVVVRLGDDAVRVQSAKGIGIARRQMQAGQKVYAYQVSSGEDPLAYAGAAATAKLMDGQYHSGPEWFIASLDGPRPDVMVQLIELNDSPRAGDVTVYSKDGWAFSHNEIGGHGGLTRHEIIVPWAWAGPELPRGGVLHGARTVDLMPTMMQLIGRGDRIPPGLDGRDMSGPLKSAVAQSPSAVAQPPSAVDAKRRVAWSGGMVLASYCDDHAGRRTWSPPNSGRMTMPPSAVESVRGVTWPSRP